jgi:two-component system cell cycle sensor histidine kinase/response regulator CckA
VVVNLATNARDAMPEGGKLQIKTENVTLGDSSHGDLSGTRSGKFVCLSVTDTGIGMRKATVDRIFEPFFSTKRQGGSAGLGLSVAYGIVKQHKGWIDVISEPGRGTTFKVYLPAHFTGDQDAGEAESGEQRPHGRGQRILLVENEGVVRGFAARELIENGYVVFEASTAEGALDIFEGQKGDFHLILTDIILPNKNGLQLVDQLRSRNPQIPILLSSSHTAEESQWPIVHRKGFRFLRKPFTSAELLQAVKETIEQAR